MRRRLRIAKLGRACSVAAKIGQSPEPTSRQQDESRDQKRSRCLGAGPLSQGTLSGFRLSQLPTGPPQQHRGAPGAREAFRMTANDAPRPRGAGHLRGIHATGARAGVLFTTILLMMWQPCAAKSSGELACGTPVTGSNKGKPNLGGSPSGDAYYSFCVPPATTVSTSPLHPRPPHAHTPLASRAMRSRSPASPGFHCASADQRSILP